MKKIDKNEFFKWARDRRVAYERGWSNGEEEGSREAVFNITLAGVYVVTLGTDTVYEGKDIGYAIKKYESCFKVG